MGSTGISRASLASLVDDFEAHGRDIAINAVYGVRPQRTTYAELALIARRFAAHLENLGIHKGERVVIWGEAGEQWVGAFFGCVLRGVMPVPLDYAGSSDFAAGVVREVAPKLITGEATRIQGFGVPALPFPAFGTALPSQAASAIDSLNAADPLQIVFTSGTTGQPKGIVHTHGNVLASLEPIEREMAKYLKYELPFHPIRILHTLPLSHVFGQFMGLWTPPLLAAEVHYRPRLLSRELLHYIRANRISVLAAVPRTLDLLRSHLLEIFPSLQERVEQSGGLRAWQRWWRFRDVHGTFGYKFWAFVCGGASLTPASEDFWRQLGFVVVQGYGMTETTALVSLNHPFKTASGTIGQVLPGREVKLSEDGEVLVRGATISDTVWQQGAMRKCETDWLSTGDLAEFDDAGNLRFRGRKKDVIVTAAGLNIYPEDLEAALTRQGGVKACAVIEATGSSGPEAVAVLALTPGTSVESVVTGANSQLAEYQRIRRYQVWPYPDLPRTSTGKILKHEISLQPVISTGELDLDSLGRVELQARMEQQFGISLTDTDLEGVRTQAELDDIIQRSVARRHIAQQIHRYPRWPWNPVWQVLRLVFLEALALPLARLLAKPTVIPAGDMPLSPALIVCNHVTSFDVPLALLALPRRLRCRVAIAMSGEMLLDFRRGKPHFLTPVAYWLITALFNVFPLPRTGVRESFQHAGEAISRGYYVLIFPEGRRSDDGALQPFRVGSGLLWKELGTPLIPLRIDGLGDLKRTGKWFRTGSIRVQAGGMLVLDPAASPEELTRQIRIAVITANRYPATEDM